MRKYCKAYPLSRLRAFDGWNEAVLPDQELQDDTIVYLWDDFTVVLSPVQEKGVIFDQVTPAWKAFCADTLDFAIPEDLRYAYAEENTVTPGSKE